uniref:HSF_DOMAIN domain-containing protein n=1 Tax=Macrostomum lignano TaxID=282301 RepID=A0A1I8FGX7_9PLAT
AAAAAAAAAAAGRAPPAAPAVWRLAAQQQQQQQQQNHHLISAAAAAANIRYTCPLPSTKLSCLSARCCLKRAVRMPLAKLFTVLSSAWRDGAEQARNLIGWTQMELEEFLAKRPLFFDCCSSLVSDSAEVAVRRGQRLSIVISESATTAAAASAAAAAAAPTVSETAAPRSAPVWRTVFHCSRLWGIIDLGRHEHVFFDRSIFKHVEDLQRALQGERSRVLQRHPRAAGEPRQMARHQSVEGVRPASGGPDVRRAPPLRQSFRRSRRRRRRLPRPPSAAVGGITGASSAEAEAQAAEAELCRLLDSLLVGPSPSLSSPVASTPSVGSSGRLC